MSDRITTSSKRELIFTADDFGLNESVNEAVELAHRICETGLDCVGFRGKVNDSLISRTHLS